VKADFQSEVDRLRGMFAQSVARNRACSFDALMETEAGIFAAEAACPLLADAVCDMDDALGYLRTKIAAAGTVDQPQGAELGDRESPFNISNGTITYTYTDATGKSATRTEPFKFVGDRSGVHIDARGAGIGAGLLAAAIKDATVSAGHLADSLGSAKLLCLERADGSVLSYKPEDVEGDLTEVELPSDLDRAGATVSSTNGVARGNRTWAGNAAREKALLCVLKGLKTEHPNAVAAVRTFERRASVSGDRKVSLLAAPYSGIAQFSGYKEVYRKGCFDNGLSGDLRVLWNHADSRMYVLGRTSAGTARFFDTDEGLCAEAEAPKTQWADDLLVSMRRGDVNESSLAFWILESEIEQRADGRYRVITRALVHDASVEAFGAYSGAIATAEPERQQAASETNKRRLEIRKRRII
jgi:HK97 family phage prohead protease